MTFPLFAKTDVNGPNTHALYTQLKAEAPGDGGEISRNFAKFLVARDGKVSARYEPRTAPESLNADIESALGL